MVSVKWQHIYIYRAALYVVRLYFVTYLSYFDGRFCLVIVNLLFFSPIIETSFRNMSISRNTWDLIKNAVINGTLEDVCELYKAYNLEYSDAGGKYRSNLLQLASYRGKLDIVRFCVEEKGLDMNSEHVGGRTALITAVRHGHLQVVKYFIEGGTNVSTIENKNKDRLLHAAATCGHLHVVQYLLKSGAEIKMQAKNQDTPLHTAAYHGQLQTVELLLKNGAEINVRNESESTPLHSAAYGRNLQTVDYLLKSGAEVNAQNQFMATPLHLAALRGDMRTVRSLVEKGANVNLQMDLGWTAVMFAEYREHQQMKVYLAEHGADLRHSKTISASKAMTFLQSNWQSITLFNFDEIISDILTKFVSDDDATKIEEVNTKMNQKLAEIIENSPDSLNSPRALFIFNRGTLYKNLIEHFVDKKVIATNT